MASQRCETCDEFMWSFERHTCKPLFIVWNNNDGKTEDEGVRIHAIDAQNAAEQWAEDHDSSSAEYGIVSQREEPTVCVRSAEGELTEWLVRGEALPHYYATKLTAGGKGDGL